MKPLVAIVGRPNVGKSTLFNRLIGRRRALVQDIPGITRDRQFGEAEWDGCTFRVIDTGGLEFGRQENLQKKMSAQAFRGIKEADIVISMVDARAGLTPLDREWIEQVRKINKHKIFAVNKVDSEKLEGELAEFYELGVEPLVPISAETGRGISDLLDRVVLLLGELQGVPSPLAGDGVVSLSNQGQGEGGEFRIAIIGRPNVGKSTLLNRLSGDDRAIVHDLPGTTRDPVATQVDVKGATYTLTDTAGIRRRGKISQAIEKFSLIKSLDVVAECDIALVMLDSTEGITDQDAHVAGEALKRRRALIFLVNKWDVGKKNGTSKDLADQLERKCRFANYCPQIFISAKTGLGTEKIWPTILRLKSQFETRIPTARLNEEFARIVSKHPLPVFRGRNIKLLYATQTGIKPPTFVVFANEPRHIHFSYERYLTNALRGAFGLKEVPIKIVFRKKS